MTSLPLDSPLSARLRVQFQDRPVYHAQFGLLRFDVRCGGALAGDTILFVLQSACCGDDFSARQPIMACSVCGVEARAEEWMMYYYKLNNALLEEWLTLYYPASDSLAIALAAIELRDQLDFMAKYLSANDEAGLRRALFARDRQEGKPGKKNRASLGIINAWMSLRNWSRCRAWFW